MLKIKKIISDYAVEIKMFLSGMISIFAFVGAAVTVLYWISLKRGKAEVYVPWLLKCSIRAKR